MDIGLSIKNKSQHLSALCSRKLGAIEKRMTKSRLGKVSVATKLDLSAVPNYVSYRAALLREKMLFQHLTLGLLLLLATIFVTSRCEISRLQDRLRSKEFILAPGVADFIPVAPQSVPDSYVRHAVSDFVATLGNTNPSNIEERYRQLATVMSPALQIQFSGEASEWIAKVKADNISEMITMLETQIEADDQGTYRVVVSTRSDTYLGNEPIGYRNEVIEMTLKLIPPQASKRWYLEIATLNRTSADAFSAAKKIGSQHEE